MPLNNDLGVFHSLHITIWYATTRIKQQTWSDGYWPYNILSLTRLKPDYISIEIKGSRVTKSGKFRKYSPNQVVIN